MPALPLIYGLDLVTNTEGPTIDLTSDRIVAIGLSTEAGEELYEGDEAELLTMVDRRLEMLRHGVLTTWGGSVLALPLLHGRVAALGLDLSLRIFPDERRNPRNGASAPISGVEQPMWGAWHSHPHLDLARVYDDDHRRWNPLRTRRTTPESHFPATDELTARDPRDDARLARTLAERRWAQARRLIDRMPSNYQPRTPGGVTTNH
ncbi:MAG: hypothetical protein R2733_14265 [Acidimicrobiales bacterium]